jgi:hypothetical protein
MRDEGVRALYVLSDSAPASAPYDSAIGAMVARAARANGLGLAGSRRFDSAGGSSRGALIAALRKAQPDAVFVAAAPSGGVESLWRGTACRPAGAAAVRAKHTRDGELPRGDGTRRERDLPDEPDPAARPVSAGLPGGRARLPPGFRHPGDRPQPLRLRGDELDSRRDIARSRPGQGDSMSSPPTGTSVGATA